MADFRVSEDPKHQEGGLLASEGVAAIMSRLLMFLIAVAMFLCVEAGKKTHQLKAKIDGKQKPTPMIFLQEINEENKKGTNKVTDTTMESKKVIKEEIKNEPYVYVTSSTPKKVENNTRTNNGEWSKKTQPKPSIIPVSISPVVVSSSYIPSSPHLFILAFIISLVGLVISFMKDDLSEQIRGMKSMVYKKAFLKDLRPKNFQPVVSDETPPIPEPDRNTLSELLPSVPQIDLSSIGIPSMTSNKAVAVAQKLQTYAVPPETPDAVLGNETVNTMSPSSFKKGKEGTNDSEKPNPTSTNPIVSSSRKMGVFFSSPFSVQANSKMRNSNDGNLDVDEDEVNVTEIQKSGKSTPAVAVNSPSSPAATVTATTTDFLYAIGNGMQTTAKVVALAATAGAPSSPPPTNKHKSYNSNNTTNQTDNASTTTSVNKFMDPIVFSDKKNTEKTTLSQSSNHIPFTTPINDNANGNHQSSTSSSGSINLHTAGDSNGNVYTLTDLRDGRSLVTKGSVVGTAGGGGEAGTGNGQGQGQQGGRYGRGRRYFDIRNYEESSKNDSNADEVVETTDKPKDDPSILNLWHVLY